MCDADLAFGDALLRCAAAQLLDTACVATADLAHARAFDCCEGLMLRGVETEAVSCCDAVAEGVASPLDALRRDALVALELLADLHADADLDDFDDENDESERGLSLTEGDDDDDPRRRALFREELLYGECDEEEGSRTSSSLRALAPAQRPTRRVSRDSGFYVCGLLRSGF